MKISNLNTYTILAFGIAIEIRKDECYEALIDNKPTVLKIIDLWREDKQYYFKTRLFQNAQFLKEKWKYGEDEFIEHDSLVILNSHQLRQCLTQQKLSGTQMFQIGDVIVRRIKKTNYIALKKPSIQEFQNPSANKVLKKLLGQKSDICTCIKNLSKQISIVKTRLGTKHEIEPVPSTIRTLILPYEEYCKARKAKRALEAGIILPLKEAIGLKVINNTSTQIFFSREEFHSIVIQKIYATERGIPKRMKIKIQSKIRLMILCTYNIKVLS
ncbi:uncharacterized protein LOC136079736 isoform X3 [Hydra vulgaris]|uniref:Uncharacterized protein LOC136079736 isoform X3 n=1 Tax=Hydra vulgaris TaxID=6087 RepID=A0ABM4BSF5_HYDVU